MENVSYSQSYANSYSFVGKTMLWFGFGILLTAGLALGLPQLYQNLGWIVLSESHQIAAIAASGARAINIITITCAIVAFITSIVSSFTIFKSQEHVAYAIVPYFIYVLCWGGILSIFCMFFDWYTIGLAFGSTSLVFFSIGIIGYLSRGRIGWAWGLVGGLFMGALPLIIVNIFLRSPVLYWVIEFAFLIAILLFVFIDFRRIGEYSRNGATSTGLAIYCAFNIYCDFIYIFVKLLQIIAYTRN